MRVYVVTMLTRVDACVAKTWISHRCVPCHQWCTHRTSLVVKKKSVFLWLWTIVIVINVCNHGERTLWNALYMCIYSIYIYTVYIYIFTHIHNVRDTKAYLHRFKIIVCRMPLWRREPNCGPPTIWLYQTSEGEREINKQCIKTR
jgi:Ca2+/Na+ antiporter